MTEYIPVYVEWDILKERLHPEELKLEKAISTSKRNISFGSLMQETRIRKKMSIITLSQETEISCRALALYESGIEVPSIALRHTIEKQLDLFS